MASITLLGLESDLAEQLSRVLRAQAHIIRVTDSVEDVVQESADIVFSTGDATNYRDLIRDLAAACPDLAVVVVNRFPENSRWLDALELGATDYCGAPFEPMLMRWLVESALRRARKAAA